MVLLGGFCTEKIIRPLGAARFGQQLRNFLSGDVRQFFWLKLVKASASADDLCCRMKQPRRNLRKECHDRRQDTSAINLGLVGNVGATLNALLPLIAEDRTYLDEAIEHYRTARKGLDGLAVGTPGKKLVHPQQVAKALSDLAAEDAMFTCDVGPPTVWAAQL